MIFTITQKEVQEMLDEQIRQTQSEMFHAMEDALIKISASGNLNVEFDALSINSDLVLEMAKVRLTMINPINIVVPKPKEE